MSDFSNRVAIVTGASAGIGLSCARMLAESGAVVVVNARRAGRLDELVEIDPKRIKPVAGDAAEREVIEAMLQAAKAAGGREADLVIANAGRGLRGSPLDSEEAQWEDVLRINTLAAAKLMRAAIHRMFAEIGDYQGPPRQPRDVVVLGSTVGRNLSPFSSFYGAAKAAIHMMAEAMRREAAPRGVRVTTIEPGVVASEFQSAAGYDAKAFGEFMESMAPVLTPDDVARAILFACQQPAGVHLSEIMLRPTRQAYP